MQLATILCFILPMQARSVTQQLFGRGFFCRLAIKPALVNQCLISFFLGMSLNLLATNLVVAQDATSGDSELELGRSIYNEGRLNSAVEVTASRLGGSLSGHAAACVNCHRRSGMGQVEAEVTIPPISGNFLFAARSEKHVATMDPRVSKRFNQVHDPYDEATLATAIRDGVNNHGRTMSVAMPRYKLSDSELKALTAYLKQLSSEWSPGVTQSNIRFATVITPDVDPQRRKAFIDTIQAIFRQKNSSTVPVTAAQNRTRHHMISAAEMVLGTERNWDIDIWELHGQPDSWGEQLQTYYRTRPVFALVSGISNSTWQPVHDFCDREHVPCWFPSVDVPGKNQSPYAFYFSGGVTLEAAVLARHLLEQKKLPKRVVQIYREGEVGSTAAQSLMQALARSGISVESRILSADLSAVESLRKGLGEINHEDVLMFWLRPDDIQALTDIKPVSDQNYFSALLAKGERAPLPVDWRAHASLVYLYELPEKRARNLDYFYVWLNIRKQPLVDEVMQSEVFFALNFMTDSLAEMLDNLYRDYLLERAETMLRQREGAKAEQETRDRVALGRAGDIEKKHGAMTADKSSRIQIPNQHEAATVSHGTTLYPHLSLGPEQRFASKCGYIVRFASGSESRLVAQSELIVP